MVFGEEYHAKDLFTVFDEMAAQYSTSCHRVDPSKFCKSGCINNNSKFYWWVNIFLGR